MKFKRRTYEQPAGPKHYNPPEKLTDEGMRNHLAMEHRVNYKKTDVSKLKGDDLRKLHKETPAIEGKQNRSYNYGHAHDA
jgi:hypothetical protein